MDLVPLLQPPSTRGASDIHLKLGQPPVVRLDGDLEQMPGVPALTEIRSRHGARRRHMISPRRRDTFEDTGDLDIAFSHPTLPRFRVNGFRQRGAISFAFRVIPSQIPSSCDLGLPSGVDPAAGEHRGLVLVTGATGSGKTTTLAAMLDQINRTRRQHIVTIEDPIEILHADRGCIVNQREVGLDTVSFGEALRRVLRQDPDVILIGELRDTETAHIALQAASGPSRLLHTAHDRRRGDTRPHDRVLPGREAAADPLDPRRDAAWSRQSAPDAAHRRRPGAGRRGDGRQRAHRRPDPREPAGRDQDAIAAGEFYEMQTFSQSLIELVFNERVDRETAANSATNRHDFLVALEAASKQADQITDDGEGKPKSSNVSSLGAGLR